MKRLIPFLIAALSLSSCLKEDTWCPTMYVSFAMVDEYLEGDYDSRIKNDVLLYIFNDDKLVYAKTIPYEDMADGTEYAIRKTPEMLGPLKFVAWAVKSGEKHVGSNETLTIHHLNRHPEYSLGSNYGAQYLQHALLGNDSGNYLPHHHERYLGTLEPIENETWERHSHHDIIMTPAPGRITVNIEDPNSYLGDDAHVVIEGGMSRMELGDPEKGRTGRVGSGTRANVQAAISEVPASTRAAGDKTTHSTNIFGVLPSEVNSELKVHIMNGDDLVKTLRISSDNTEGHFTALHSGDYLVFNYNIASMDLSVTIGAYVMREINSPL